MVTLFGKEIRRSEKFPEIWINDNCTVYSYYMNSYRKLEHYEDANKDRIVKCGHFKGGWCYVGELMEECWPETHKEKLADGFYNNMKTVTQTTVKLEGKYVEISNSATICEKYNLRAAELLDIFNLGLRRSRTPKTKMRKDSVKDSVKRERAAKAEKEREEAAKETGLRYPKNYVPNEKVPPINLWGNKSEE